MAKLVKRKNSLERRYNAERRKTFKIWMIPLILIVIGLILLWLHHSASDIAMGLLAVGLLMIPAISVGISKRRLTMRQILKSGIEGEKEVLRLLAKLPNDFTVIPDVRVETISGGSQLDFVILHAHGIWIVESKHMTGKMTGNLADEHWKQIKTGRGGSSYQRQFYNPVKQVGTHVYRLKETLKTSGIHPIPWIQGVVYFSNPDAAIHVRTNQQHPVLHSETELIAYIKDDAQHRESITIDQRRILSMIL